MQNTNNPYSLWRKSTLTRKHIKLENLIKQTLVMYQGCSFITILHQKKTELDRKLIFKCVYGFFFYSMLCITFSKYERKNLGKIMYCRNSTGNLVKKKKSLFVSQATKQLQSLIHHENARMPDSWLTDQLSTRSLSPHSGAPLIQGAVPPGQNNSWAEWLYARA